MREEFYDIYREVDAEYSRQPRIAGAVSSVTLRNVSLTVVDEALSAALEESSVPVRPDAVHFLRINLHQMIVEPLFLRERRSGFEEKGLGIGEKVMDTGRLHRGELKDDLKHDAIAVLREAARESVNEITGHQLINALSRSWDDLRLTGFNVWG